MYIWLFISRHFQYLSNSALHSFPIFLNLKWLVLMSIIIVTTRIMIVIMMTLISITNNNQLYRLLTQWVTASPGSAQSTGSADRFLQAMNMSLTCRHSLPIQKAAADKMAEEALTCNWSESSGDMISELARVASTITHVTGRMEGKVLQDAQQSTVLL